MMLLWIQVIRKTYNLAEQEIWQEAKYMNYLLDEPVLPIRVNKYVKY